MQNVKLRISNFTFCILHFTLSSPDLENAKEIKKAGHHQHQSYDQCDQQLIQRRLGSPCIVDSQMLASAHLYQYRKLDIEPSH